MPLAQLTTLKEQLCPALQQAELWPIIASLGSCRSINAGTRLITAGDQPRYTYIVIEGLLRHFYHSPDGRERNKNFFTTGQLAGSLSAHLTQKPCPYNLEAMEDCRIIQFPNREFWQQKTQQPCVQEMLDITIKELFLRNEQREAVLLTKSGEERYQWVLENEDWLVQRLPQYQLASYLGMDAVSLSRIKARQKQSAKHNLQL